MPFPRPTLSTLGAAILAALASIGPGAAADSAGWYGRLDVGWERATDARFRDWNCGGTDPAAIPLYGCLARAAGDFGRSVALAGGIGYRLSGLFRVDATLGWRPGFRFDGQADFPVAGDQSVRGDVSALTGLVTGYVDLAPLVPIDLGRFRPFVGAGVGISRNRLDRTTLSFPTIPQQVTTPGGTTTSFAWTVAAGTGIILDDGLTLEIAYRYTDLGRVETERGYAVRQRPSGTILLPIDGTRADLRSHGVSVGLRYAF
ncbi:MAG: porin family protein [Alphaproteobacteria bacterium]|nr:porin family protein [Alphaproteobacteria bacterium]